jgi:excinuclease UvrABC ATPase subunit
MSAEEERELAEMEEGDQLYYRRNLSSDEYHDRYGTDAPENLPPSKTDGVCQTCHGTGFVQVPSGRTSARTGEPVMNDEPCPACDAARYLTEGEK